MTWVTTLRDPSRAVGAASVEELADLEDLDPLHHAPPTHPAPQGPGTKAQPDATGAGDQYIGMLQCLQQ